MIKIGNIQTDNYEIRIKPNDTDDFEYLTMVNGLYLKGGGSHINFIADKITQGLKEKLQRKFKDIKPGDIKNKIKLYVNFRMFPNPSFKSQTKEELANSAKEINKFLKNIEWDEVINKLYRDKELIEKITEFYTIKQKIQEQKALKKTKKKKKIVSDKYTPSIGRKEYLFLTEGASANSFLMSFLGRSKFGYIEMMGVPMNTWEENIVKIANSKKFELIQQVCGIDYVKKEANPEYKNIVIAVDRDIFGFHIAGLLIAYFYRFAPNIIKQGRLKILKTPLLLAFKNDKLVAWFYDFESYAKFEKENPGCRYEYNKGLGSNDVDVMEQIKNKDGLNNMIETIEWEDNFKDLLNLWFKKDLSDKRKKVIKENPFNINAL